MHVDVSTYLETAGSLRAPVREPHTEAEERRTSRAFTAMARLPSGLLDLHEERLELGGEGVRVTGRRRQEVGERPGVARVPRVAPVNREADLPDLLPGRLQRPHPLGHHRDR